ncbi:VCBS repeat-containing protein [bacterium]|nr:VCBS repeat-containing protein [bacterium]
MRHATILRKAGLYWALLPILVFLALLPTMSAGAQGSFSRLEYEGFIQGDFRDAVYHQYDGMLLPDAIFLLGERDVHLLNAANLMAGTSTTLALNEEAIRLMPLGDRLLVGQYKRNQGNYTDPSPTLNVVGQDSETLTDYPFFVLDIYNPLTLAPVSIDAPDFSGDWNDHPDLKGDFDIYTMVYNDPLIATSGSNLYLVANRYQDRYEPGNWPFWWDLSVTRWDFTNPFNSKYADDNALDRTDLETGAPLGHTYWYQDVDVAGSAAIYAGSLYVPGLVIDLASNQVFATGAVGKGPVVFTDGNGTPFLASISDSLGEPSGVPGDVLIADISTGVPVLVQRLSTDFDPASALFLPAPAQGVAVTANGDEPYLFVTLGQAGFRIYNITDPAKPLVENVGFDLSTFTSNATRIWAFRNESLGEHVITILAVDAQRVNTAAGAKVDIYNFFYSTTPPPVLPGRASSPSPARGATNTLVTTALSWVSGTDAVSHAVYLGTSANQLAFVASGLTDSQFDPVGDLAYGARYYWRVDEVGLSGTTTGEVWSFTTEYWAQGFGIATGWQVDRHPRMMADVNGDGRADIVGFANNGLIVALSLGDHFETPKVWVRGFGYGQGWLVERHPRNMTDINGDGRADVLGFANNGVVAALSNGSGFNTPYVAAPGFGFNAGWTPDRHIRTLIDITGDGYPDVVGFGDRAVTVAVNNGAGDFSSPERWLQEYGTVDGWSTGLHPRILGDVNNDGAADIVGFFQSGVLVSRAVNSASPFDPPNFSSFEAPSLWIDDFGIAQDYQVTRHDRLLGDVNGDGRQDLVVYGEDATYVARSTGFSFLDPAVAVDDYSASDGLLSTQHLRLVRDQNSDGKADLIVFGQDGVDLLLSESTGGTIQFSTPLRWTDRFGYADGWRIDQHPRMLADVNGDGYLDIIAFGAEGVEILLAEVPRN